MNAARRGFPWRQHALVLLVIVFGTALPYLLSLAALGISRLIGCDLGTFAADVCQVAGADLGGLLRNLYGFGWMILATLPLGGGALLTWLVVTIIHRLAWSRLENPEGS